MDTKVLLTSAYPISENNFGPPWLIEHSRGLDGFTIVEDPEEADVILFVENHPYCDLYFFDVRAHPYNKRYPEKCVLFHDADASVTAMRTIAPCLSRWQYNARSKASFHYIARFSPNDYLESVTDFEYERRYLYCFDGSTRTNLIRKRIMALQHPDAYLADRGQARSWQLSDEEKVEYQRQFVESMLASRFILAPAGIGPASYRMFETMQLARVPVIVADQWMPILGVDWDSCSIRIAEKDIERIPEILEARVGEAEELGRRARQVWESQFSPEASLQRICEAAAKLAKQPYGFGDYLRDLCQFRDPYHLRGLFRYFWKYRYRDCQL